MYKEIYKKIKKYNNIVIARHIGPDPDALASQMALRDSIKLTFPDKNVIAVGSGSSKFSFIGSLDKLEEFDEALLIVTDTPDIKRIDGVDISKYSYKIKIDHHPFIEKFCDIEYIDDSASSACEIIMDLILNTKLRCNKSIAKTLYTGLYLILIDSYLILVLLRHLD
ncbi:MAG: DHH family phosphoesterase [Bacilli bacterium]|nr:DHH family phosphoesterase [Bacilli bacterium]